MTDRNIRSWISMIEGKITKIDKEDSAAIPGAYAFHQLTNQDAYKQYRMGVAVAAARAADQGLIDYNTASQWGENLIMVSQTEQGARTIELAMKLIGVQGKLITTPSSDENHDVNKSSPVAKFKPTKKSR